MPDIQRDEHRIIEEAISRFSPSHVFGLLSGGHDSLCASHVSSKYLTSVVHINTGIGIEETRQFVRNVSREFGWDLREYSPPESYERLVVEHGFPGPAHHYKMYQRLKERCLEQILRETKTGNGRNRILFISGRRAQESVRRMANCTEYIQEGPKPSKRAVWVNPIMDWGKGDKGRYMDENDLPRNPVVDKLCMSGECLCGAFAKPGELDVIRTWYPAAAAEIDRIATVVKANGKPCKWGQRPSAKKFDSNQLPLCFSCEEKFHG